MKQEQELIPYECSPLPEGPYLVCAPHPDDETFGMGGTIVNAVEKGIRVYVLFVTDGSAGGDGKTRKEEARRACNLLGVHEIYFWDFPDRQLISHGPAFEARFREIVESLCPRTVFVPSLFEFHPDHRATAFFVWKTLAGCRYAGQFWMYEVGRQGEANRLIDISSYMSKKIEAIRAYSSQLQCRHYEDVVVAINRARTFTLEGVRYAEAFFCIEAGDDLLALLEFRDRYVEGFSLAGLKKNSPLLDLLAVPVRRVRSLFFRR